jgi:hypothetical protein
MMLWVGERVGGLRNVIDIRPSRHHKVTTILTLGSASDWSLMVNGDYNITPSFHLLCM